MIQLIHGSGAIIHDPIDPWFWSIIHDPIDPRLWSIIRDQLIHGSGGSFVIQLIYGSGASFMIQLIRGTIRNHDPIDPFYRYQSYQQQLPLNLKVATPPCEF